MLGKGSSKQSAGSTKKISVKLTKKASKLILKSSKKIKAKVKVTITPPSGAAVSAKRTVKLRGKG